MAESTRIPTLSMLAEPDGSAYLQELYGRVIENVQKGTISSILKNTNLSGDPTAGSVEANRFANSQSVAYGTARAGGQGAKVKVAPVVVQIDRDREIVEEIEQKDISLFGVDGLLNRRSVNHERTLIRELERSFFQEAADAGTEFSSTLTDPGEKLEALIQKIETVKNDFVDGVDRDMMAVIMNPYEYGRVRNFLDKVVNNSNISTEPESFNAFHGVRVFSSVYLPASTGAIGMVYGSVAQPVMPRPYAAERIPLSEAWAVSLFFYYGVKAVTPDLIFKYEDPSK